jgi:hypothetical protein
MRAPDNKRTLSLLERACREASRIPKSRKAARAIAERPIARLLRRDETSRADLRAVAAYYNGEFDRKREQGRPVNPLQRFANDTRDDLVRDVKRELGCTYKEAVAISFELVDSADPDGRKAKSTLKRVTR